MMSNQNTDNKAVNIFNNLYNYCEMKLKKRFDVLRSIREMTNSQELLLIVRAVIDNPSFDESVLGDLFQFASGIKKQKIPTEPPGGQRYIDRPKNNGKKENAVEFIIRVYGGAGLLDGNFTRAALNKCDSQCYQGLYYHEKKYGRLSLGDLNLPTIAQRNDEQVKSKNIKEIKRLAAAANRRL